MSSAESCRDLELGLPSCRVIDEKGQPSLLQGDEVSSHLTNSPWRSLSRLCNRDNMSSFRPLFLTVLIIAFLTATYAFAPMNKTPQGSPATAKETPFQDLLNSVSDASLHHVLINVYEKYKRGAYPEDRKAMNAVHDEDAAMATSLVELARRQNNSAVSIDSSTSVVVVSPTGTVVHTLGASSSATVQSVPTSAPVTTAPPASVSSQGTASTKGTTILSSSDTALGTSGSTLTSTPSDQSGSSNSAVPAPTAVKSSSTQQILVTTTLPNGSQSTVTSFTVVPAGDQVSTQGSTGATMSPGLQNGAVGGTRPKGFGIVGFLAAALVFVIGIL